MKRKKIEQLQAEIRDRLSEYYEDYYRIQLGLIDWKERVQNRLEEEQYLGQPNIQRVIEWMEVDFRNKKVLVVGAGTGAESVVFHQLGAVVHGVEPDDRAIKILELKSKEHGIPVGRFKQAKAERLPYGRSSFDFVYCYTVIEHVQDVAQSVAEMIRVCKVGGLIYIQTPEYRFPYEGHYKSGRVGFSPRWLTKLQYWLQGKPTQFLDTLNFVTAPMLDRIFVRHNVLVYRIAPPYLVEWERSPRARTFAGFARRFGFGKDQFIFLKKQADQR